MASKEEIRGSPFQEVKHRQHLQVEYTAFPGWLRITETERNVGDVGQKIKEKQHAPPFGHKFTLHPPMSPMSRHAASRAAGYMSLRRPYNRVPLVLAENTPKIAQQSAVRGEVPFISFSTELPVSSRMRFKIQGLTPWAFPQLDKITASPSAPHAEIYRSPRV
jgi:hypothetical protein